MKNKMTKLALLLLIAAAGSSARAQTALMLRPDIAHTFTGTAASGSGTLTYQWYRNGATISGATGQSYTLPANLANGRGVEFKRGVVSSACPGQVTYSNIYYVTFCGLMIGQVCWARENAVTNNAFASRPDEYTPFFQWNRVAAWPAVGDVFGWNSTADQSTDWAVNPCPNGWRLPTQAEFIALTNLGSTWAAAGSARGNAVAGYFFGPNANAAANCSLPDNMNDCVFLPAAGDRTNSDGSLSNQGTLGNYWSRTQNTTANGYSLYFESSSVTAAYSNYAKAYGLSVRCVQ